MAQNDRVISALDTASELPVGSFFYVSEEDLESSTGYASFKIASEVLAEKLLSAYNFPLLFDTTAKNAVGAVNELAARPTYKEVTGTLTAGNTSLTLTDAAILTTSTIDIYTDVYGIAPESVTVAAGSLTMTFEALSSDLVVKARIS